MVHSELPVRLPEDGEEGVKFIDWLDARLGGNRLARQRLVPFIEEWDLLRDEVRQRERREPTVAEYGKRWSVPESTAFRLLEEYRQVFRTDYPGPLCDLLWNGMPRLTGSGSQEFGTLMTVKVVDARV
jgi:hypothetical protein